jgi:hypothetical protein
VALGSSSIQFDIRMPLGSNATWQMGMYQDDGVTPFPLITAHTFEYVCYTAPPGSSPPGSEIIRLRSDFPGFPVPVAGGLLALISNPVLAAVSWALYPAATVLLSPATYFHALWMDYADPANATNLWWGNLYIDPAVQP